MPSSAYTTALSNVSSASISGPNNWPPRAVLRTSYACAPPQTTEPTTPDPLISLAPRLVWEKSGNVMERAKGALPPVSAPHFAADGVSRCGSSGCASWESAQPQSPRLRPVDLPPQISGVTTVTLNPVLRSGAHIDVNFASIPGLIDAGVAVQPATFPELPSMTLLSKALPWAITVHASTGFVAVGDVYTGNSPGVSHPYHRGTTS
ncbi:hypothetical protein K438DRAFT_1761918 [Mycena galopus ATCC 62051]|nr:hypothetical protein K438DRAFT_1761918 [Mycena galopus ATCC 62051]